MVKSLFTLIVDMSVVINNEFFWNDCIAYIFIHFINKNWVNNFKFILDFL